MPLYVAIRECWEGVGVRQVDVADRIGRTQTQVSKYGLGQVQPDVDIILAIEKACGRPAGWILNAAGYIATTSSVPEAVAMDASLSVEGQRAVLAVYETFARDH